VVIKAVKKNPYNLDSNLHLCHDLSHVKNGIIEVKDIRSSKGWFHLLSLFMLLILIIFLFLFAAPTQQDESKLVKALSQPSRHVGFSSSFQSYWFHLHCFTEVAKGTFIMY
jgi:hypothetical protein